MIRKYRNLPCCFARAPQICTFFFTNGNCSTMANFFDEGRMKPDFTTFTYKGVERKLPLSPVAVVTRYQQY